MGAAASCAYLFPLTTPMSGWGNEYDVYDDDADLERQDSFLFLFVSSPSLSLPSSLCFRVTSPQLSSDLERIASGKSQEEDNDEMFTIMLLSDKTDAVEEVDVWPSEVIWSAVAKAFCTKTYLIEYVELGEESINNFDTFGEYGVEDGARLTVGIQVEEMKTVSQVMRDLRSTSSTSYSEPYVVSETDPSKIIGDLVIKASQLPESFGSLTVTGDLILCGGNLKHLPRSFGSITVGGDLILCMNKLQDLPDSIGDLTVWGNLDLSYNKLTTLPDSFSNVTVGKYLNLHNNDLESLPRGFGARVGGTVGGVDHLWTWDDY